MFQGPPKYVTLHLRRMGRRMPKGENSIEYLSDIILRYDQSDHGVEALAVFAQMGRKPLQLSDDDISILTAALSLLPRQRIRNQRDGRGETNRDGRRPPLHTSDYSASDFDHVMGSPYNSSRLWMPNRGGVMQAFAFTSSLQRTKAKSHLGMNSSVFYMNLSEIIPGTLMPHSSECTVNEEDYLTPSIGGNGHGHYQGLGRKFTNSFFSETWILMRWNFKNIKRTPEIFLSRMIILTVMGVMMASMFNKPKAGNQGITNRISYFIFMVCPFFFSSKDAVTAFIQERFIFVRETLNNAYRASSYTITGLITYFPFLVFQAEVYAGIIWFVLDLQGQFHNFLLDLYMSLLSTNSFVVFVSSVVPNYILRYAAIIAFTALFFLFCGYFLNSHDIPPYCKWMNKTSTMTYSYKEQLMNQYQTSANFGMKQDNTTITGLDILSGLHISHHESDKWRKVLFMLVWTVRLLQNTLLPHPSLRVGE